jgi:hypothetical protein
MGYNPSLGNLSMSLVVRIEFIRAREDRVRKCLQQPGREIKSYNGVWDKSIWEDWEHIFGCGLPSRISAWEVEGLDSLFLRVGALRMPGSTLEDYIKGIKGHTLEQALYAQQLLSFREGFISCVCQATGSISALHEQIMPLYAVASEVRKKRGQGCQGRGALFYEEKWAAYQRTLTDEQVAVVRKYKLFRNGPLAREEECISCFNAPEKATLLMYYNTFRVVWAARFLDLVQEYLLQEEGRLNDYLSTLLGLMEGLVSVLPEYVPPPGSTN